MSPDSDVLQDDESIPNDSYVLRRIPPGRVVFDHAMGRIRPQSDTFKENKRGPASVLLGHLLAIQGLDDISVIDEEHAMYGLVKVPVRFLRDLGFGVVPEPRKDDPANGHIIKPTEVSKSRLKRLYEQIACKAEWIKEPVP